MTGFIYVLLNVLMVAHAHAGCMLLSRPLPEYGDMDPSCGLTDDRACK